MGVPTAINTMFSDPLGRQFDGATALRVPLAIFSTVNTVHA